MSNLPTPVPDQNTNPSNLQFLLNVKEQLDSLLGSNSKTLAAIRRQDIKLRAPPELTLRVSRAEGQGWTVDSAAVASATDYALAVADINTIIVDLKTLRDYVAELVLVLKGE